MFRRHRHWRGGANGVTPQAGLIFSILYTVVGSGLIIDNAISRDWQTLLVGGPTVLVGPALGCFSLWVMRRNYVYLDDESEMVHVVASGMTVIAPFSEANFAIPAHPSLFVQPVYLLTRNQRVRCGLFSQGKYWQPLVLAAFVEALDRRDVEWHYFQ